MPKNSLKIMQITPKKRWLWCTWPTSNRLEKILCIFNLQTIKCCQTLCQCCFNVRKTENCKWWHDHSWVENPEWSGRYTCDSLLNKWVMAQRIFELWLQSTINEIQEWHKVIADCDSIASWMLSNSPPECKHNSLVDAEPFTICFVT